MSPRKLLVELHRLELQKHHYLLGEGRTWQRFGIDPEGPSGTYIAMALDSHGRLLIAYYAKNTHGSKVYDETLPPLSRTKQTTAKTTSAAKKMRGSGKIIEARRQCGDYRRALGRMAFSHRLLRYA